MPNDSLLGLFVTAGAYEDYARPVFYLTVVLLLAIPTLSASTWRPWKLRRGRAKNDIVRLATEICSVAESIRDDLVRVRDGHKANEFNARRRRYSAEAERALKERSGLKQWSDPKLVATLENLHHDHFSIVNLRCEVDAELAGRELDVRSTTPPSTMPV
jgi:hypothetical protein